MFLAALLVIGTALGAEAPEPEPDSAEYTSRMGLAVELARRGALPIACAQVEEIVEDPASARERELALRLAEELNERDPQVCAFIADGIDSVPLPEPDPRSGAVELAVAEGFLGLVVGSTTTLVYAPNRASVPLVLGTGLVVGGMGVLSAVLSHHSGGVTEAQAMMVYGSQVAGTWLAAGLEATLTGDGELHFALPGFVAGTLLGIAATQALPDATAGDVALVRSSFVWGLGLGLVAGQLSGSPTDEVQVGGALAGSLAGGLVGLALTPMSELDRKDVLLLNVGVWGGVVTGVVVGTAASANSRRPGRPIAVASTSGGLLGLLAMAALVASDRKARRERFSAGLPHSAPGLIVGPDGRTHPGVIVQGRW